MGFGKNGLGMAGPNVLPRKRFRARDQHWDFSLQSGYQCVQLGTGLVHHRWIIYPAFSNALRNLSALKRRGRRSEPVSGAGLA